MAVLTPAPPYHATVVKDHAGGTALADAKTP
jgi:hypothetical protein